MERETKAASAAVVKFTALVDARESGAGGAETATGAAGSAGAGRELSFTCARICCFPYVLSSRNKRNKGEENAISSREAPAVNYSRIASCSLLCARRWQGAHRRTKKGKEYQSSSFAHRVDAGDATATATVTAIKVSSRSRNRRWIVICESLLIIQAIRSSASSQASGVSRSGVRQSSGDACCRVQQRLAFASTIRYVLYNEEQWNGSSGSRAGGRAEGKIFP